MASRRGVLIGAAVLSMTAGLARWRTPQADTLALLFDESLSAGRQFAAAGRGTGAHMHPIVGDRVRLTMQAMAAEPAMIVGVSRPSDAMMIQDVAREAGYSIEAEYAFVASGCAAGGCTSTHARHLQWVDAGTSWPVAPVGWLTGVHSFLSSMMDREPMDSGLILGWILARR